MLQAPDATYWDWGRLLQSESRQFLTTAGGRTWRDTRGEPPAVGAQEQSTGHALPSGRGPGPTFLALPPFRTFLPPWRPQP